MHGLVGDLTDYDSVESLVAETVEVAGHIDVLANVVGGATNFKPFVEWDPKEMLTELNRSLLPTLFSCHAVLPHMIARRSGRIVNVGAESVRNGLWDRAPYNVGKGGVHALKDGDGVAARVDRVEQLVSLVVAERALRGQVVHLGAVQHSAAAAGDRA